MKTIFFHLPTKMIARDLFLIPGSAFDILKKHEDLKIVVLVSKGLYQKIENFFDKLELSERIIMEKIDNYGYQNVLQKIFATFCKYLALTDTLKLLATEGVRTDVSPAGGKAYLYFLKWLNYQIFGRSKWIKKIFAPKAFFKIINQRPYKYLFDQYNPDLVFLPDVKPLPSLFLLAEAQRRKTKTVQMPGNWDHFKYYFPLQGDLLLAQNEPLKEEAIRYENYIPENIKIVGFPRFDFFLRKENIIPREIFFEKIGFPIDSKVILFVSEGIYSLDGGDIVDMIIRWIESGKLDKKARVLLRPYPPYPGNLGEGEKYGKFEGHSLVFIDAARSWNNLENFKNFINLLYHSDIVINTYSTVSIEAAAFDKPVINIGFDGYKIRPMNQSVKRFVYLSHFQHVTDTGGIKTVKSEEELFEKLDLFLKNPDADAKKRKLLKEKMCYKIDGKTSERIVGAILEYLYEKS